MNHCKECDETPRATTTVDSERLTPLVNEKSQEIPQPPTSRAWLTVLGSFLSLFCTIGQMNSFGTFQSWYTKNELQSHSPSAISLIGTLQLWSFFFSGGVIGWYFDRYGPRTTMCLGTVVYVFSIMMTSLCRHYYQYFLCQGVLFGFGVGLLFYPSVVSVSTHFSQYRGTAVGIAIAGSSAGGVVFPIMLQRLFESVGFANAVRISGCICFACCAIAVGTVTSRLPPGAATNRSTSNMKMYANCFKDMRFILLLLGSCLISLGLYIPFFYIVDFVQDKSSLDKTSSLSTYILAVMNAGGFLGRIIPSFFSDKVGGFNSIVPCAFFAGLSCLALWLPAASSSLSGIWELKMLQILFAGTYGFFSGGFISLINVCVTQISDMREVGSRVGLLYCLISFPSLAGGPVAGALLQHAGRSGHAYAGMAIFSGVTLIIGSFFIFWTKLKVDSRLLAVV